MKIRNGWVSNSSSSSFLIYGAYVGLETMLNLFSNEEIKALYDESVFEDAVDEDGSIDKGALFDNVYNWDNGENIQNAFCDKLDLSYESLPEGYGDEIAVGRDPTTMRDDETMGEFKNKIKTKLMEVGIPESAIGWHSEAWYDG